MKLLAFSLAIICFAASQGQTARCQIVSPTIQPYYIKAGDTLKLVCHGYGKESVEWLKEGQKIDSSSKSEIDILNHIDISHGIKPINGNEVVVSELTKVNVTKKTGGVYTCQATSGRNPGYGFTVYVIEITPKHATLLGVDHEIATISCRVDGTGDNYKPMTWYRNGAPLEIDGEKYVTLESNNTLEIHNAKVSDSGEYECVGSLDNSQKFNATVHVNAAAYVRPFERSKNLVQDDPLNLDCHTEGFPVGQIKWSKVGDDLDFSDPRISTKEFAGIANATLHISDLKMEDAGEFMCTATNSLGSNNATVTVRVKDKLAALWPFLGICVEVVVLCVIIFIYERRRAKKMEEEEEREEAGQLTNSHDHKGKDEIRQRK